MLLPASTQPKPTITLNPSTATAMARTHMRMRVQSPMLTMSDSAPMVQKCVRWVMAPKATARENADQRTVEVSALRLMESISILSRDCLSGLGHRTTPPTPPCPQVSRQEGRSPSRNISACE